MMRRKFLGTVAAGIGLAALAGRAAMSGATESFPVTRSDEEWRAMLSDIEYKVMRQEGTERPGTSPLNKNYDAGIYHCRGCEQALYSSEAKFDSGTGWPSFFEALPDAVGTKDDRKLLMLRTELHCDNCGSHLGHVFKDGPPPTGMRHCINGVSLVFRAA